MTPLKAIRKNCIDCMGGSIRRVKSCDSLDCPFHQYRFGKNPKRKGIGGSNKLKNRKELFPQEKNLQLNKTQIRLVLYEY